MLHYFQQSTMSPFSETLEKPVKELMDLNVKALQSMSYLNPTELLMMRRPEDVMEKNMKMFIENSNAALAYMHNMFNLMEKHWLNNVDEMVKNTKSATTHAKQASHATTAPTKAAKPVASKAKASTSKSKSSSVKAKSAAVKKQPVKHAAVTMNKDNKMAAKPVTPEVKHMSTGSSHMPSSASQIKPMTDKK